MVIGIFGKLFANVKTAGHHYSRPRHSLRYLKDSRSEKNCRGRFLMKQTCRKLGRQLMVLMGRQLMVLVLMVLMLMVTLSAVWWDFGSEKNAGEFGQTQLLTAGLKTDVINPHPYRFTTAGQDVCEHAGSDVFLVIIVHTAHAHVTHRQAIRATWGNESNIPGLKIKTLFALGTTDNKPLQQAIERENTMYGDIIQENFQDSYKNLTLKTVMTLKWFLSFCPKAAFLMKTDDDTYVNVWNLVKTLRRLEGKPRLVTGFVIKGAEPRRDVNSKWYLSPQDYPKDTLPWYVAGGTGYVISSDLVPRLYEMSLRTKAVPLEDVYIGMCLENLGITPVQNKQFHCCDKLTYDPCVYKNLMTSHGITVDEMYTIWEGDQTVTNNCGIYYGWIVPAINYLLYT
ncbi:beta-1,3-galactosyltransferase 1-like [Branchiostoma floridae x Branchiostoma belcheri]